MTNYDDFREELMKDPEFRAAYEALEPEYAIRRQLLLARSQKHLTQEELANRIGIQRSSLARLESGNYNPSLCFLKKVAKGLGKKLVVTFEE
ncbi:MAG: helix-turn-helix transcriptional regulator [Planctomycetia bacterium]|nr:helix-turn-helix transcriptional regulator [Planctomycetia bacterium]